MSFAKTVLLVDDDGDFVEMNRVILEEKGFTVHTAFNGKQCMEQVTSDRPDLTILDMMMEDRNEGFNLSRELRNSEYTKDIPPIMITSVHDTIPFRIEPDKTWLPVDALIEKPVDPVLLLSVVERILSR
jgi:CheY-like chemotaxis protein